MICDHEKISKQDLGAGVHLQMLGQGDFMNALHWNMDAGSVVPMHQHTQEQFGYVIRGGFEIVIDDQIYILKAGDAYFIPPNAQHSFTARGETEAIDVFNPVKSDFPWLK